MSGAFRFIGGGCKMTSPCCARHPVAAAAALEFSGRPTWGLSPSVCRTEEKPGVHWPLPALVRRPCPGLGDQGGGRDAGFSPPTLHSCLSCSLLFLLTSWVLVWPGRVGWGRVLPFPASSTPRAPGPVWVDVPCRGAGPTSRARQPKPASPGVINTWQGWVRQFCCNKHFPL